MPDIEIIIDGKKVNAPAGMTVAAAVLTNGVSRFRTSVTGEPRAALCGMGVCYECRLTINGVTHSKSCQIVIVEGMEIETDGSV